MNMRRTVLISGVIASIAGCGPGGGGGYGGYNPTPVTHTLAYDQYQKFPGFLEVDFSIPAQATVDFDIVCRSTTTPDKWSMAIFTPTEWSHFASGMSASGYVPHNHVSNAADSTVLFAGDYVLGFHCENLIESCELSYTLRATY